jgi:TatD DNase family protein
VTAENNAHDAEAPLFADSKGRPIAAPDFGGHPIADTHAHLDMLEDPVAALANAARAGIGFIATVADPSEDASRTYRDLAGWLGRAGELLMAAAPSADIPRRDSAAISSSLPHVRVILGVHPHNAKDFTPAAESLMRELAENPLTCGVGEIGLDYHYDYSPRDVQRDVFRHQLELAHELELPAVIHLREAHEDGLAILREAGVPPAGCILHCYNLGPEAMSPFLAMGCYVSFAGPITFKKSEELRQSAASVPAGRILTETDCPFMAPEPFRGRKNEPAYTVFTAARIAEARGESPAAFAVAAYANALRVLDQVRS